jgi:hypothetical protein
VGKIKMRETAYNYAKDMIDNSGKSEFKMLTLPSTAWEFEKDILNYAFEHDKTIVLHAFEYDWDIFVKIKAFLNQPVGQDRPLNNNTTHWRTKKNIYNCSAVVHNTEVFEYLQKTNIMFDYMWLDLMSPVDMIRKKVIHASNRLHENGILILSFTKGREKFGIADRVGYICEGLPDMIYIEDIEYCDTSPMVNVIFRKKLTLEGLNETVYLGPETKIN